MLNITKIVKSRCPQEYIKNRVDFIKWLFNTYGNDNYTVGFPMTHKQHAIHTFKYLKDRQERDNLCISGFLHDIGYPLYNCIKNTTDYSKKNKYEDIMHDKVGSALLSDLNFNDDIVSLVNLHVDARKYKKSIDNIIRWESYTCFQQDEYMSQKEMKVFSKHPLHIQALQLREADDNSKIIINDLDEDKIFENALSTISKIFICENENMI